MWPRLVDFALLVACVGIVGVFSVRRGQDANWDLQNYHFYNPWAWLQGRRGYMHDFVAAQLQTFHSPIPDIPFYLMVSAGWDPRAIAFALAVPAGIAAFVLLKLFPLLFADLPPRERVAASVLAFVVSVTSAMGVGTLGTTMNEWPGAALTLAGVWVLVRALVAAPGAPLSRVALVAAGLLCGLATGLKLTFGTFAFALCVALWLRSRPRGVHCCAGSARRSCSASRCLRARCSPAARGCGSCGRRSATRSFPTATCGSSRRGGISNEVIGRAYGPHTFREWIRFPLTVAAPKAFYVTETEYVDARLPLLYVLALAAGAAWIARRLGAVGAPRGSADAAPFPVTAEAWRVVGVFWALSFLLWTAQHSIYRYLVPLEMLTGALLVGLLLHLMRPGRALPAAFVLMLALTTTTSAPDWWRLEFKDRWFDVRVPPVEKDALVLLTSDGPMSYVLPFFPADARFLGLQNNINDPERKNLLAKTIARTIKEHKGPLYSLTYPVNTGVDTLLAHDLLRLTETCRDVVTNMRTSPIQLCLLFRIPPNWGDRPPRAAGPPKATAPWGERRAAPFGGVILAWRRGLTRPPGCCARGRRLRWLRSRTRRSSRRTSRCPACTWTR